MGRQGQGSKEELLKMDKVHLAAISLHEAVHGRYVEKMPMHGSMWDSYRIYHRCLKWSHVAVLCLLLLTIFEVPTWCKKGAEGNIWKWRDVKDLCASKEGFGPPPEELMMSNLPTLPIGVSLTIEYILLIGILVRILISARLHVFFRDIGSAYRSNAEMILDYVMILLGFCDVFYFSFFPSADYRIAPFVRFGLGISIPWIRDVVISFTRVTKAIFTVGLFLLGTIIIFAWLGAMMFDDLDMKDQYDMPINQGFENFGNSIYTMFAAMTTATLPDAMVPSYAHNKATVFFWMPFFVLGSCVFTQVILATVYADYGDQVTELMKLQHSSRSKGIKAAFEYLKAEVKQEKDGQQFDVVHFEAIKDVVSAMRELKTSYAQEELIRVCFDALDTDGSSFLTLAEFRNMCTVLLTTFMVVKRDSPVKQMLDGKAVGKTFAKLMTNGEEGPDLGCSPPVWMPSKFSGSPFDKLVNGILVLNVAWLLLESVYDLNDIPESEWFSSVDSVFCLCYIAEVMLKLCWWSWQEYWMSNDNRFDFFTTGILAGASLATMLTSVSPDVVRYINLLRLVRLLKALNNIEEYRKTWEIISRMVSTCGDVLAMNLLMIYLWSAAGLQLFGGQIYKSNPILKDADLDYFESHFEVYNFNDMGAAMVSMFFVVLTDWVDQISLACMALHEHYTVGWFLTVFYWLSFYIGAPLIAWNVWTAFSIDVFCMIKEMQDEEDDQKTNTEKNLEPLQAKMAEEGVCLHIRESAALGRDKVYAKMFEEDDDDDKEGSQGSSDKGDSEEGDD
mmetsp:Transcript_108088/g.302776  ORF Transcript_108088/g.302776 Transcript_108088/m.302776 type:complete len:786 (+) Transcript_108088:80-2437(+)